MNDFLKIAIPILVFVVTISVHLFADARAQRVLESWMKERNYRVISKDRRSLHAGPFSMGNPIFQIVYRICVEDATGLRKWGWAFCWGFIIALFSAHMDVVWDDWTPGPVRLKDGK